MTRESLVARTMVELADSLVDDFDLVDMLATLTDRCVAVLDVAAAGVMLAAPDGRLRLMASSDAAMRVVELFELQSDEGPCLDCFRSGHAIANNDLSGTIGRWPFFAAVAVAAGYQAADALPLRLRGNVIGAINLFRTKTGALSDDDLTVGQAFADVATIAIVQHCITVDTAVIHDQLTAALQSRIVIEQAKGIVAERQHLGLDEAFARLRSHARNHNRRLADVAHAVVNDNLSLDTLDLPRTVDRRRSRPTTSRTSAGGASGWPTAAT